jgi:hypothetical protein
VAVNFPKVIPLRNQTEYLGEHKCDFQVSPVCLVREDGEEDEGVDLLLYSQAADTVPDILQSGPGAWIKSAINQSINQCSGSGSTCFLTSRIRIHWSDVWIRIRLWIRILLSSCKNNKKNLEFYYFVTLLDFLSLKNNVNVPSKSNKQKKLVFCWNLEGK